MRIGLTVLALVLLAAPPLVADEAPKTLDITAVKDKVQVVTDGKGHFVVINPAEISDEFFFYGDGKTMWGQRTHGGGRNGDAFSRNFWDPRAQSGYQAEFEYNQDKKYVMQCLERKTEM